LIKLLWSWLKSFFHQERVVFVQKITTTHEAYDPFSDPDKIMKGESESYFD
jgi:hypothetical protein